VLGSLLLMPSRLPFAVAATLGCLVLAQPVHAEIVHLTSGRTLSVKGHRVDGEIIVLMLRAGGEVNIDRDLVERIVEDEVPYPEPAVEAVAAVQTPALPAPTPYAELIASMSAAHGVDPNLVRALIQVESGYRARALSPKGAMGLMQLMPSTAREYKVRNPYDPKANIAAGVKHLKGLIDRWGVELALAAYNAGEGAVRKFNGVPPYRETRNYVSRILSLAGGQ
jgi:soluble lytic murein transglycosylase-like protein